MSHPIWGFEEFGEPDPKNPQGHSSSESKRYEDLYIAYQHTSKEMKTYIGKYNETNILEYLCLAFETITNTRKNLICMLELAQKVIPKDSQDKKIGEIKTWLNEAEWNRRLLYLKVEFPIEYSILMMLEKRKEWAIEKELYEEAEKVKREIDEVFRRLPSIQQYL